jgi:hypothetical protein
LSTKSQPKTAAAPAAQLSHCPPETINEMYMQLGYLRGTGYEHATRMTELFNKIIATHTTEAPLANANNLGHLQKSN